ncbi:hypothetical protein FIM10_09540 [Sphingomonadales bacterium 56]|uniref:hypothetical protein n=1 Tax=unclassified Sphingobium TaxID=2611147 RepID=UPI001917E192|nr:MULTISPECIES: hypothetical protein [unclassified Sphingobium]MBY2928916.1 hypothetical protein [Sphingomonadales bacterium 56]MBY2959232.1 hypothetical protein [Sphingomonadales bacterium 58]
MNGGPRRRRTRLPVANGTVWTQEEDACLRKHYPAYDLLRIVLPHRSLASLKHRVRRLGIVRQRHVWTNVEVRRLHSAFANHVPDRDLEHLFPGLRLGQIKAKAGHIKAPHRRGQSTIFGISALDAIRERAKALGMSYVELDRRAQTGKFFQKSSRHPGLKQISRAADLLGGDVAIAWDDAEC